DRLDDLALRGRLSNQGDVALWQITQASVDHLRRAAAGPRGEVARLDQGDAQTAHGRIAGHARAGNPSADDQQVETLSVQGGEQPIAVAEVEGGRTHTGFVGGKLGPRQDFSASDRAPGSA